MLPLYIHVFVTSGFEPPITVYMYVLTLAAQVTIYSVLYLYMYLCNLPKV